MSFPTVRERILENLRTVFLTIDGTGSLQTTVGFVGRDLVDHSQVDRLKLPAIFLTPLEDDLEHRDFQKIMGEMRVLITGYVSVKETESASIQMEKLIHDIWTVFYIDIQRGINPLKPLEHNAVQSRISRIVEPKGTSLPLTTVELTAVIEYRSPRADPGG